MFKGPVTSNDAPVHQTISVLQGADVTTGGTVRNASTLRQFPGPEE